jgi:hypothetical protein
VSQPNSPLEYLHVASPCHASWDAMSGDDQARFCGTCQKNVFNISMMTRTEAERLIASREGNLCVRYAQREDGTIITNDCPVGMEKAKVDAWQSGLKPWRLFVAGAAGIVTALCGAFGITPSFAQPPIDPPSRTSQQLKEVKGDIGLRAEPSVRMGEPAICPRPAAPEAKMTMGKPAMAPTATVVQGFAAPSAPASAPKTIEMMGGMAPPQSTPSVKPPVQVPVKPAVKKAPIKVIKKTAVKTAPKQR